MNPKRPVIRLALTALLLGTGAHAVAETPAIFKGADLALGKQLIADNNCSACHAQKVGGRWQRHLPPIRTVEHGRSVAGHG